MNKHALIMRRLIVDYEREQDYYAHEGGIPEPSVPCPYADKPMYLTEMYCDVCLSFVGLSYYLHDRCPCNELGTEEAVRLTKLKIREILPDEEV